MTGFLEVEIRKFGEVEGKKYPVKFGNYALLEYGRMNNLAISEVDPNQDLFGFTVDILFCGLKNVSFLKNEVLDVTLEDVRWTLDDLSQGELESIIKVYLDSIHNSKFIQDTMKAIAGNKDSKKK